MSWKPDVTDIMRSRIEFELQASLEQLRRRNLKLEDENAELRTRVMAHDERRYQQLEADLRAATKLYFEVRAQLNQRIADLEAVNRQNLELLARAERERDDYASRHQAMHRRAQKAESELASLTKRTAAELRTLDDLMHGVQQNELHWLLQFLYSANLADAAMTEGLRECERLRVMLAARDSRIAGLEVHAAALHTDLVAAQPEFRKLNETIEGLRGEVENHSADRLEAEHVAAVAMRAGLKECMRLRITLSLERKVSERLRASADNAFRMLAHAEMNEEAAKKRAAVLTHVLDELEFDDRCPGCTRVEDEGHDPGCIVGIALGRIPTPQVNDEQV